MQPDSLIDLGTRIQRRRDFVAHLIGFLAGASILTVLHLASASATTDLVGSILVWATALSSQHFLHLLQGTITPVDVQREQTRLLHQRSSQA